MHMANHVMKTVVEAYEAAIRLEQEFTRAEKHKDYKARSEGDDCPKKRKQQQYQQT